MRSRFAAAATSVRIDGTRQETPRRWAPRVAPGATTSASTAATRGDGIVDESRGGGAGPSFFRERWRRATGETVEPCPPVRRPAWPGKIAPAFSDIDAGVSRTGAAWRKYPEVRENEALHVASIRAAKSCIYMENQYFTSPIVAAELAKRLREPDGPEVVLITTEHAPSYFDRITMDHTRLVFFRTLRSADRHGRFRIYSPVTTLGRTIIVHAKLTIIDDTLLRIGSSNINNRSLGFDTECDLSLEATGPHALANRKEIIRLRNKLLAHWLGCPEPPMEAAIRSAGGVCAALEAWATAATAGSVPSRRNRLRPWRPSSPPTTSVILSAPATRGDRGSCRRAKRAPRRRPSGQLQPAHDPAG